MVRLLHTQVTMVHKHAGVSNKGCSVSDCWTELIFIWNMGLEHGNMVWTGLTKLL